MFCSQFAPEDDFTKIFDVSTHIVVEPVLAWIPRNSVVLDDLAKLNVVLGEPKTRGCCYDKWQGVGTYYVPDFDFENYSCLGEAAQQQIVLDLLSRAFRYVADLSGNDASLCFDAIRRVLESGLPLPRLNSESFWQSLPPQKRRSKSYRRDIEFLARIVDRNQHAQQSAARDRAKSAAREQ
jgi:hypothetical protein